MQFKHIFKHSFELVFGSVASKIYLYYSPFSVSPNWILTEHIYQPSNTGSVISGKQSNKILISWLY